MNNELMIFEGKEVEIFELQGKILFNPNHVGKCLELSESAIKQQLKRMNNRQVIKIRNSDISESTICTNRKLNNRGENFLTEAGVYKMIFASRSSNAERFQDWVTDEVLPTIRKTGGYINNAEQMVDTYFGALDDTRKTLVKGLFENIEQQQKQIAELKPKAEGFTQFLDTKDTYSWDIVAKNLGIGRNTMLSILRENNILQESTYTDYKGRKCYGEKHNIPYQAYMKFFDVKFLVKGDKKFSKVTVNADGQEYLRRKLIKLGYLKEAA